MVIVIALMLIGTAIAFLGAIFAAPALIPTIQQAAYQSKLIRWGMVGGLSFLALAISLSSLAVFVIALAVAAITGTLTLHLTRDPRKHKSI